MSDMDEGSAGPQRAAGGARVLRAAALALLWLVPLGATIGVFAGDRFSAALGISDTAETSDGSAPVGRRAWESLSRLGGDVDLGLFVSRKAIDDTSVSALRAARRDLAARTLEGGAKIELGALDVRPAGPDLTLTLTGELRSAAFVAELSAVATLEPKFDAGRIALVPVSMQTATEQAALRRPTLNPANTAAKAEPVMQEAYEALQSALVGIARDMALPVTLPQTVVKGRAPQISAAYLFDSAGLHVLARVAKAKPAPAASDDDDLLTGSLASAGLTREQYRSAFLAARQKSLPPGGELEGGAELVLAAPMLSRMLGETDAKACRQIAVETAPLVLTGTVPLAKPPASPQCRAMADECAARDLCSQESTCAPRPMQRTVEETVKVPVRREVCGRMEYVCYGWGPYGCAWGENVCVAPRRVTEYREKTVQRVVASSEANEAPACQSLRATKAEQPGFCARLADRPAPNCAMIGSSEGMAQCQAMGAALDRMRDKPTAQVSMRIVGRGMVDACTTGTATATGAKVSSAFSGKLDLVAEVSVRAENIGDGDAAITCTLEPSPAIRGSARLRAEKTRTVELASAASEGRLGLTIPAGKQDGQVSLDKAALDSLFGQKAGLVYRCRTNGNGEISAAQWDSKIGPALREIAAKAGRITVPVASPALDMRLPQATLLGRPAEARMVDGAAIYAVAAE